MRQRNITIVTSHRSPCIVFIGRIKKNKKINLHIICICIFFGPLWLFNLWTILPFYVCFVKCSLSIRATALIFELNVSIYSSLIDFKYESSSPLNDSDIATNKNPYILLSSIDQL